jgi:peptide/nickel transport system ATP-binding protein
MPDEGTVVVRARGVKKYFEPAAGIIRSIVGRRRQIIKAVDGVDLDINRSEILSLVGESGSGKTTTGEVLILLQSPSEGSIFLKGTNLSSLRKRQLRKYRRQMQIVFQDPYQSLDPRMTVFRTIAEPIRVNERIAKDELSSRVMSMLEQVGLSPPDAFLHKYPTELSGGQRQRVAIARALVLKPDFVVADEPVSMLDVSVASGILNLMLDLRQKYQTAFLFITHDLAVARYISDRIAIMYRGNIVELGSAADVVERPYHPYTQLLLSAVPVADVSAERKRVETRTDVMEKEYAAVGCRFQYRCPWVKDVCRSSVPELVQLESGHSVACYKYPSGGEAAEAAPVASTQSQQPIFGGQREDAL